MLADVIYQKSLSLPEPAAQEVLNFIDFLRFRCEQNTVQKSKEQTQRKVALAKIASTQVDWNGKPIADRNQLYDETRD